MIKDLLLESSWNEEYTGNKSWERFINDVVGKWVCNSPAEIRGTLNYYQLHQKRNGAMRYFQDGKICYSLSELDPFKDALIVHFLGFPLAKAEVFEYRQHPFEEVIILEDIYFLSRQFENFDIFKEDGTKVYDNELWNLDQNMVAVSKKTLNYDKRDDVQSMDIHVVMRYITPEARATMNRYK